jgi:hypothetical protein
MDEEKIEEESGSDEFHGRDYAVRVVEWSE